MIYANRSFYLKILCIFIFVVISECIHCPIISVYNEAQLRTKENCTSTNLIHITHSDVTDLLPLGKLKSIEYIPMNFSSHGAAIVITDNKNLLWSSERYFSNLEKVNFSAPPNLRNFIVVRNNKEPINEEEYNHLLNLTGDVNMIDADRQICSFNEFVKGARCEVIEGSVIINSSNYFNKNLLLQLEKVKFVQGRIIINNTQLYNIAFLESLEGILNPNGANFTLEITNNIYAEYLQLPNLQTIYSPCKNFIKMRNNGNLMYNFTKRNPDLAMYDEPERCSEQDNEDALDIRDDSICVFNGDFILGPDTMHQLDVCRSIECRNLTINEKSENIDWHVFSGIHTLRGCLTIINTTLQSLNFTAHLHTIRNCKRGAIILLKNNPFLERLDMGFMYCPDHLENSTISFVNNIRLCLREIQSFEKQIMLKCGIKVNKYGKIPLQCPFDRDIQDIGFESLYYLYASIVTILSGLVLVPLIIYNKRKR